MLDSNKSRNSSNGGNKHQADGPLMMAAVMSNSCSANKLKL